MSYLRHKKARRSGGRSSFSWLRPPVQDLSRFELEVTKDRVGPSAYFVLDQPAAGRAAELAKLYFIIDKPLGLAD
jgi:hypothetical protein